MVTGGEIYLKKVIVYNIDGWVEDLPDLNTGRIDHGCGHYVDNNNEIVGLVLLLLLLMFVLRSTWSLVVELIFLKYFPPLKY